MYAKVISKEEKDYKYLSFTHFVLHYLFNYNPRYVWHQHKWFYCSLSLRHINTYEERVKFKCIYVGFCYQTMTEHKKVLKSRAVYDIISKKHDRENYRLKTVRKKLCLYEILQIHVGTRIKRRKAWKRILHRIPHNSWCKLFFYTDICFKKWLSKIIKYPWEN